MNLRRFSEILSAYGSKPERWPEAERQDAVRLAGRNTNAVKLLDEAGSLDILLDALLEAPPLETIDLASLRATIVGKATGSPQIETNKTAGRSDFIEQISHWLFPATSWLDWRFFAAAILPLALGFMVGLRSEFSARDPVASWDEEISMMALTDSYGGLIDD